MITEKQYCKHCGVEIDERYIKRVYCSRSCRNKANPRRAVEVPKLPKICVVCGKSFLAKRSDCKYCSGTCRDKARYLRKPRQSRSMQTYWRGRRHFVLEKQDGLCWLCQKPIAPESGFNVHHLEGDHDPMNENVVALHRGCHTQLHGVSLIVKDGEITFESPVIEQVRERIKG